MTTRPARALATVAVLVGALVLTACGGSTDAAPSMTGSPSASAEGSASAASAASASATQDRTNKDDRKSSAPAPQPTPTTAQPTQQAVDCALAMEALGAYFPAFTGFSSAMSSGDPGQVFSAARQFADVLNGFQSALPGMSANSQVFISLSKEATRIALTASESGDPAAIAAAAAEIQTLLQGDANRHTSGQEELQQYLDANCGVAP